jgi:predicted metal-dependent phosphotriesterase family hydrolase
MSSQLPTLGRRDFLLTAAAAATSAVVTSTTYNSAVAANKVLPRVHTVLGPVPPEKLGLTLMHEHAPLVDWSELYEFKPAPLVPAVRNEMLKKMTAMLQAFEATLTDKQSPGAIVECTPIRVGRDPRLLVDLAQRVKCHLIAATGFWCEAFAPQHPWAIQMGLEKGGIDKIAQLYIREIREGMEDPTGQWGEKFTNVKAGVIKIGTSAYMTPSERRCNTAAAIASSETGCPITTHTTDGGGLEQARLLLAAGAKPQRVIIGHMGNKDDREQDEAYEYQRQLVELGCYVQFDRVGHDSYAVDKCARQIRRLVDAGFAQQILVGHDWAPYFYRGQFDSSVPNDTIDAWTFKDSDYTIVTKQLLPQLAAAGVAAKDIHAITIGNPARVLAF